MKDYYKILEVTPTASQAEIKKAYRLLAVQYHPDKNNGNKASEECFKEISEAYVILGDTAKRNAYNYTKGHYKNYAGQHIASKQTPVTYLILFKRIKDKVFNANCQVNQEALFKVLDDLLSDENIKFLMNVRDTATNNLIIDEVLTCCIFLSDTLKTRIYTKLTTLSDGDPRFTQKVDLLNKNTDAICDFQTVTTQEDALSKTSIAIFIAFLIFFVALLFVANKW
jgi:molecular chaperone DnaJ